MKMKSYLTCIAIVAAVFATATSFGQFPRQGVHLLSHTGLAAFPGGPGAGSGGWGYTSHSGREYAVFGMENGTAVVDITNPNSPVTIGHVSGPASIWHEPTVLGDFAYSVCDGVNQGMQIIDLRFADLGSVTLAATYTANDLRTVHTIQANQTKKLLYLNGSNLAGGGLVVLDATNPVAPVQVGSWSQQYVHDCQVVNFSSGPYAGREIAFLCCGGAGVFIVDITNKSNMVTLGSIDYISGSNYCHSGQLTEDGRYFLVNDEFDEGNGLVDQCTTHRLDVSDLAHPQYAGRYQNGGNYIDHNSHIRGNTMYLSAYRGGIRVYDIGDPLNIQEIGYFDTYPDGSGFSYTGAWGVCAIFPSGNVTAFDINRGLFVLDPGETLGQGAYLDTVEATAGRIVSGGKTSLRKSDSKLLHARYEAMNDDSVPIITLVVEAQTDKSPVAWLDLEVQSRIDGIDRGVCTAALWNWDAGRWDDVGSFEINTANGVDIISNLPTSTFSTAQGLMRLRLTIEAGFEADIAAFDARLDLVRFNVRA